MKKIACLMMTVCLALCLTACGRGAGDTTENEIRASAVDEAALEDDIGVISEDDGFDVEIADFVMDAGDERTMPDNVQYKMAELVHEENLDGYWSSHAVYAIELLDAEDNAFSFAVGFGSPEWVLSDTTTGKLYDSDYADEYDRSWRVGEVCLTDISHYGFEYWGDDFEYVNPYDADKDILMIVIDSKEAELPSAGNIEVKFPMWYENVDGSKEFTFSVNAEASEITASQPIVHSFNPCLFNGQYFYAEINASGASSQGGPTYNFISLSSSVPDKDAIRDRLVPVIWDVDAQEFVPVGDTFEGYAVEQFVPIGESSKEVSVGWLFRDAGGEVVENYNSIAHLLPAYVLDDGSLMCFAW